MRARSAFVVVAVERSPTSGHPMPTTLALRATCHPLRAARCAPSRAPCRPPSLLAAASGAGAHARVAAASLVPCDRSRSRSGNAPSVGVRRQPSSAACARPREDVPSLFGLEVEASDLTEAALQECPLLVQLGQVPAADRSHHRAQLAADAVHDRA